MRWFIGVILFIGAAHAEEMHAPVLLNSVEKPAVLLERTDDGRLLVSLADFKAWGIEPPADAVDGERVLLDRVPWLTATFDENAVKLVVDVEPERLPAQRIAVRYTPETREAEPEPSAFLNWSLLARTGHGPSTALEQGIRLGRTLFYGSGIYEDARYRRLQWAAIRDDRSKSQRVTIGDHFTSPGSLTGPVAMTGVSVATERTLNPYRTFHPVLSLSTAAALPSEVEVRVDGQVVRRERVAPGPVQLEEITGAFGSRNVEVVVRDSFGREQVLEQDFIFADTALRAGTHEFGYSFGALRDGYGTADDRLGALAFSATHRYGFSDNVTLGAAAQASAGMVNIGPSATLITRAGVFNVASSHTRDAHALGASWSYRKGRFGVTAAARHNTEGYVALPSRIPQPERTSFSTSAAVGVGPGNASVGFSQSEELRVVSAGYVVNVSRNSLLMISAAKFNDNKVLAATLRVALGKYSANATAGTAGNAVEVTRQVPRAEGWGGGVRISDVVPEVWGQLNAEHVMLHARANSEQSITVAGGIGYVGGRAFFSRPLHDAFGVVKVGDLEGVEVHAGGARAVTDERGEVVVPLVAHGANAIRFDKKAVPLDYTFTEAATSVSPAFRSGVTVAFDVRVRRSVMGRLVDAQSRPIENRELTLRRKNETLRTFTAKDGEFSVEDIAAGEWTVDGCAATLRVPEEPLAEVGEVICSP